jgi:aminopeptidase N
MSDSPPVPETKYLKNYRPPAWLVDRVELDVALDPAATEVMGRLAVRRNPEAAEEDRDAPLALDGEDLELLEVRVEGAVVGEGRVRRGPARLVIDGVPDQAEVATRVRIAPEKNTRLEGLYLSNGVFCTQCEAEGFRRITYFPDRPDVMSRYRVRIEGLAEALPVLLSNGNLVDSGAASDGRHYAVWEDPFPKPCYLFALVAGDLARIEDRFRTRSGRDILLEIYTEHAHADKCDHAMASLKKAMCWDEKRFGLEYDLDRFMIVAIGDFNMGAMENKGLNVFNTKYVLAKPETATDADYLGIESVVAHEYFHNWTGNRVTCRDWFQLSLKEGFTVFRDQEFTSDVHDRAVKRIADVKRLRAAQFPEDAGPLAHPVRPESYVEINNFYTVTVYEKGAEVIRMLHTLIGEEAFQAGMRLYFERHDGEAVRCEDFVRAMEDASGRDLGRFRLWYAQAGTPALRVEGVHDPETSTYTLTVRQEVPPTPGQPDKHPMPIPLAVGLVDPAGRAVPLRLEGENTPRGTSRVLEVDGSEARFVFADVAELPVPSLLRGFSAPVRLEASQSDADLLHLLAHDEDPFARYEAGQVMGCRLLLGMVASGRPDHVPDRAMAFVDALGRLLDDPRLSPAYLAEALVLPGEGYLSQQMPVIDVDGIHAARHSLRSAVGRAHEGRWRAAHDHAGNGSYRFDSGAVGERALRNLALGYLMAGGTSDSRRRCLDQLDHADNMTDRLAALSLLVDSNAPERSDRLAAFYRAWQAEPLVVDKWFALQAMAQRPDAPEEVEALAGHPAFTLRNPNRVRSLFGVFAHGNPTGFHRADGAGYSLVAACILDLDASNPQVAARLVGAFSRWRRYDMKRQARMKEALTQILARPKLSPDVYEIATKSLSA